MDIFERQYNRERDLAQLAHERATMLFVEQARNGNGGACSAAAWITGTYLPIAEQGLKALQEAEHSPSKLLKQLDELGFKLCIAIAIEAVLDELLAHSDATRTAVLGKIAERLDQESVIGSFTATNPLRAAQLHKRAAKELASGQKKTRMFLMSSEVTGDPVIRIPKILGVQLGGILCGLLLGAGMITETTKVKGKKSLTYFSLSQECVKILTERTRQAGESFGMFSPMLHKPLDWALGRTGGYQTPAMRDVARLVLGPPSLSKKALKESSPEFFEALNALQGTPWKVNKELHDVVRKLALTDRLKEVVPDVKVSIPEYPAHLQGIKYEDRTPEQQEEHQLWVNEAREAYAAKAKETAASLRFIRMLEDANMMREEEEFYFVWAVDSRGRLYPRTYGMSPQGSDLQKALLQFAKPSKITNEWQLVLFYTNLAHRWGFDKEDYETTVQWVKDNHEHIMAHAADPLTNDEWTKADSPFLYLAAAMEYRRYHLDPENFESFIPIAADGACNGLN